MAVTLIQAAGLVKGVDAAETGFKIESFKEKAEPQFREPVLNEFGEQVGTGIGAKKGTLSISGEIVYSGTGTFTASSAPLAATTAWNAELTSTIAATNLTTELDSGGGWYAISIEVTKDRGSWQSMAMEFESFEGQA
tara:strand:- start:115 stop:525 length:411 start_codon:yes stop_codon:yes gene_type:complete